ncbi:hypothetical protein Taro_049198 [Colocasia esculenta]|uniref:Uncharacterized protein n=1 Tax=Colocasia esculenta TaxID=4460 RepID=A0A843XA87_COLES|nr:hypothetical protein [Colocasia esculenta]
MATKVPLSALLLLTGLLLLGEAIQGGHAAVICPQFCVLGKYMTCRSSGKKRLPSRCNCCYVPKGDGCVIHLSNGKKLRCP